MDSCAYRLKIQDQESHLIFFLAVFDMFSQAQTGVAREHGGLGIGLSLVKQLVEMHGGQITAKSDGIGRGSTFCVRLPEIAASLPPEHGRPEADGNVLKDLRVLLVDDSADTLDAFRTLLEMEGAKGPRRTWRQGSARRRI